MCLPLIAAGLALGSAYVSAKGQEQSAKYNDQIAKQNAQIEDWKAKDAIARGSIEASNKATETGLALGHARAQAAANGGVVDTGSNLIALEDIAGAGKTDELTIRSNARREAFGNDIAGTSLLAQATLGNAQAKNNSTATLLQGGANAFGAYKQYGGS